MEDAIKDSDSFKTALSSLADSDSDRDACPGKPPQSIYKECTDNRHPLAPVPMDGIDDDFDSDEGSISAHSSTSYLRTHARPTPTRLRSVSLASVGALATSTTGDRSVQSRLESDTASCTSSDTEQPAISFPRPPMPAPAQTEMQMKPLPSISVFSPSSSPTKRIPFESLRIQSNQQSEATLTNGFQHPSFPAHHSDHASKLPTAMGDSFTTKSKPPTTYHRIILQQQTVATSNVDLGLTDDQSIPRGRASTDVASQRRSSVRSRSKDSINSIKSFLSLSGSPSQKISSISKNTSTQSALRKVLASQRRDRQRLLDQTRSEYKMQFDSLRTVLSVCQSLSDSKPF